MSTPRSWICLLIVVTTACSVEEPAWRVVPPGVVGMDKAMLDQARDFAMAGGGSGYVMRSGRVVMRWGSETKLYDLKSSTKSIGVAALGLALMDGLTRLDEPFIEELPELTQTYGAGISEAWLHAVTPRRLAMQTAGFGMPGGYCDFVFEPGTAWAYSDCGPNWLADYLTVLFGEDLQEVLSTRVFAPIGISNADLKWRNNAYRDTSLRGLKRRELGSGIQANIRAMALIGELYRRGGVWDGDQILPEGFVDTVGVPHPQYSDLPVIGASGSKHPGAPHHYGLLWWNNADGTLPGVPRDAFWSWGLHESCIVVIPSLEIVAVRAGGDWPREGAESDYDLLGRFLNPIVASVNRGAPYPNSSAITGIVWADQVFRAAEGSDNWPVTWGSDGALYTAYGDGWGFAPRSDRKLSLGVARIEGAPPGFVGRNIASPTGEQLGDGASGKKASGLLAVDGTLYMWVRNASQDGKYCQLAWSEDGGKQWTWSSWVHTGVGYCVFLNFGKDYAGSRDEYIYSYSPDTDSAYVPSDAVILMRVRKQGVKQLTEYEYFAGVDSEDKPRWTALFDERAPVFTFEDGCNRLDITYNKGLEKYLMTMRNLGQAGWQPGGRDHWSIYESSQPWGPWSTVFYTEQWDMDPGEALRIPSKWISTDGAAFTLVFSGNDSFSTRNAQLSIRGLDAETFEQ